MVLVIIVFVILYLVAIRLLKESLTEWVIRKSEQMRKNKIFYGIIVFFSLLLCIHLPSWADAYFREVVNATIEKQVEERRDEIEKQVKSNIRQALRNEKTQQEVQTLLRQAVAAELEQNGERHLRRVIERRAPHAIPLLFPNKVSPQETETRCQ